MTYPKKLTPEYLESLIIDVDYQRLGATTTTICALHISCGKGVAPFVLIGTAACINPADFDLEKGKETAYRNAFDKLWELEGYHQKRLRSVQ